MGELISDGALVAPDHPAFGGFIAGLYKRQSDASKEDVVKGVKPHWL